MNPYSRKTPELVERARTLRASGMSYGRMSREMGFTESTLQMWVDPEYNAHRRRLRQERDRVRANTPRREYKYAYSHVAETRVDDADVAARLAEIPPDTRTLGQRLMGDPIPGRSALDRRRQA